MKSKMTKRPLKVEQKLTPLRPNELLVSFTDATYSEPRYLDLEAIIFESDDELREAGIFVDSEINSLTVEPN